MVVSRANTVGMRFVDRHPTMQERGKVSDLARALRITPSAISQWSEVPADKVVKVAEFIGVHPSELRPDMFEPLPASEVVR